MDRGSKVGRGRDGSKDKDSREEKSKPPLKAAARSPVVKQAATSPDSTGAPAARPAVLRSSTTSDLARASRSAKSAKAGAGPSGTPLSGSSAKAVSRSTGAALSPAATPNVPLPIGRKKRSMDDTDVATLLAFQEQQGLDSAEASPSPIAPRVAAPPMISRPASRSTGSLVEKRPNGVKRAPSKPKGRMKVTAGSKTPIIIVRKNKADKAAADATVSAASATGPHVEDDEFLDGVASPAVLSPREHEDAQGSVLAQALAASLRVDDDDAPTHASADVDPHGLQFRLHGDETSSDEDDAEDEDAEDLEEESAAAQPAGLKVAFASTADDALVHHRHTSLSTTHAARLVPAPAADSSAAVKKKKKKKKAHASSAVPVRPSGTADVTEPKIKHHYHPEEQKAFGGGPCKLGDNCPRYIQQQLEEQQEREREERAARKLRQQRARAEAAAHVKSKQPLFSHLSDQVPARVDAKVKIGISPASAAGPDGTGRPAALAVTRVSRGSASKAEVVERPSLSLARVVEDDDTPEAVASSVAVLATADRSPVQVSTAIAAARPLGDKGTRLTAAAVHLPPAVKRPSQPAASLERARVASKDAAAHKRFLAFISKLPQVVESMSALQAVLAQLDHEIASATAEASVPAEATSAVAAAESDSVEIVDPVVILYLKFLQEHRDSFARTEAQIKGRESRAEKTAQLLAATKASADKLTAYKRLFAFVTANIPNDIPNIAEFDAAFARFEHEIATVQAAIGTDKATEAGPASKEVSAAQADPVLLVYLALLQEQSRKFLENRAQVARREAVAVEKAQEEQAKAKAGERIAQLQQALIPIDKLTTGAELARALAQIAAAKAERLEAQLAQGSEQIFYKRDLAGLSTPYNELDLDVKLAFGELCTAFFEKIHVATHTVAKSEDRMSTIIEICETELKSIQRGSISAASLELQVTLILKEAQAVTAIIVAERYTVFIEEELKKAAANLEEFRREKARHAAALVELAQREKLDATEYAASLLQSTFTHYSTPVYRLQAMLEQLQELRLGLRPLPRLTLGSRGRSDPAQEHDMSMHFYSLLDSKPQLKECYREKLEAEVESLRANVRSVVAQYDSYRDEQRQFSMRGRLESLHQQAAAIAQVDGPGGSGQAELQSPLGSPSSGRMRRRRGSLSLLQ